MNSYKNKTGERWGFCSPRCCVEYTDSIWMNINRSLQWRHNGCHGVSNHQPHHCLLNRLFMRRSKKISKPRVSGLCAGNSPVTGKLPAQMASYTKNVSIWWRHHVRLSHSCVSLIQKWDANMDMFVDINGARPSAYPVLSKRYVIFFMCRWL